MSEGIPDSRRKDEHYYPMRVLTDEGWTTIAIQLDNFIQNLERWQQTGLLDKLREHRKKVKDV